MTETTPTGTTGGDRPGDPFVAQVQWLIGMAGGKDQLVARSGNRVSARTLDNWVAGRYPRAKVTGAVRDLDIWASANVPGYPQASGFPRLTDSCGPHGGTRHDAMARSEAGTDRSVPPKKAAWVRWVLAATALVVLLAGTVVTTVLLTRHTSHGSRTDAGGTSGSPASAVDASSLTAGKLPTNGNGTDLPEQTGGLGANTFADPRTLQDQEKRVPKRTTVMVRCRYYSPIIASVTPDGFWYLLDSGEWAGRWSPANSYMNGDLPGKPTLHNTDFAVPVCH